MPPVSDSIRLTRAELYELVWSKPMSKVAPELRKSGAGLVGICRRHSVPRPSAGYFLTRPDRRPIRPPLPDPQRDDVKNKPTDDQVRGLLALDHKALIAGRPL